MKPKTIVWLLVGILVITFIAILPQLGYYLLTGIIQQQLSMGA